MRTFISRLMGFLLVALFAASPLTSNAAETTAAVIGTVAATNGAPLAGAQVDLIGPVRLSMRTDAQGKFTFPSVPIGLYTMQVSRAGYKIYRDDSVAVFIGETATVNVALADSSFSSLKTIASVSTNQAGVAQINTSTAAVSTIGAQTFENQGVQQVTAVLNQTPGIFTTPYQPGNSNPSNGASPASAQTPQIRGALPYETESLIDGHPVSVGATGTFSPNLIDPFLLQDVELVKGPGSMPAEINYAINGTVNYRTLEPTTQSHVSSMFSTDKWGGIAAGIKATGQTSNRKIGYVFGYVSNGAPGPLENFRVHGSQIVLANGPPGGPFYVNGQPVAMIGSPIGEGLAPAAFSPYAGMGIVFTQPLTGCCYMTDTGYHSTSELGKIVFNFSNNTALKLSYLGGQSVNGNGDVNSYDTSSVGTTGLPAFSFQPCGSKNQALTCYPGVPGTTYNCASPGNGPACGASIPFDLSSFNGEGYNFLQQNLFQGELRTTFGRTGTLLARYYSGALNNYATEGPSHSLDTSLSAFGTIPLCPVGTTFNNNPASPKFTGLCSDGSPPTNTTFNGQRAEFSTASQANTFLTNDTMRGGTIQLQEQLGQNTLTVAYDRSQQGSTSTTNEPSVGLVVFSPVAGSKQIFQTYSLRGDLPIGQNAQLSLSDYQLSYLSHYSIDGGVTFNDARHAYSVPRAALTWRPNYNTIVRVSAGGSVAPPYISLVSSGGPTWSQIIGGVPSAGYIQNANNGNIAAETAWSYDLGVDRRIARETAVSFDVYSTQLHNLFLTSRTTVTGAAATGCPNAPCVVSRDANLGQARYQGIELGLNHVPTSGFGWKLQGSLQRAYTYNLPPYFYCAGTTDPKTGVTTPPGPGCIYNTNLAVLPNVNFGGQPTAISGAPNGINGGRVPYATGYGEVNWNGRYGQYYNLGATYFGNNNSFNEPAFVVFSANARFKLNDHGTRLQISGDNLTGQYSNPYAGFFNGIPLSLVNGATQTSLTTGQQVPVYYAATAGGNYGPTTFRIILRQDF